MVIPSPIEEHLGEVWDPKDNLELIESANRILNEFIEDMDNNRLPESTINNIIEATDTIGLYAGYPMEACNMETYLKSEEGWDYREIATILNGFVKDMNILIAERVKHSQLEISDKGNESEKVKNLKNDDVPF